MKVLFVTSEAAPIRKFGGLGDYSSSLPKALEKLGLNVDVVIPYYKDAKVQGLKVYKGIDLLVPFNNKTFNVEIHKTKLPDSNVDVLLVKSELEFTGDMLADSEFFAFFDRCIVEYVKSQYNTYDLIHCNDWHTGLVTHLLVDEVGRTRPKTLITIHNVGYQGVSSAELVREVGIAPSDHPLIDWDIADGDINMLFQGITSSDYINTVSPSYAKELLTEEFGKELADVITARESRFVGILNGLDYSAFPRNYDESNWKPEKSKLKGELIRKFNLEVEDAETTPIFSFISRMDPNQKGLDILYDVVPKIVEMGGKFVLLGTGDKTWEEKFANLANDDKLSGSVSINIKFDVQMALDIYEGSDFFFVPSRYEPCGLTQMISMWYGTVPVARAVGGLKDTITHNEDGLLFEKYSADDFGNAIREAFAVYNDKSRYKSMVEKAIVKDFGWEKSAWEYKELYSKILSL